MNPSRAICRTAISRAVAVALGVAMAVLFSTLSQAEEPRQTLPTRMVHPMVAHGKVVPVGPLPLTQQLRLHIALPVQNQAGLDSLLQEQYDPESSSYRHWLTVQEFTEKFGPSQQDYDAVVAFAKANGFTVYPVPAPNRRLVAITGSVESINKAFHVVMTSYQHPTENRTFYSPDREPTLDLSVPVQHIAGLDNYTLPHSISLRHATAEETIHTFTTGSGPGGEFLGSDMRAAYYGGTALTGTGQYIGLFGEPFNMNDVTLYFSNVGQTLRSGVVQAISIDGTTTTGCNDTCDDGEQMIDIMRAYSMAPGVAGIFEFEGSCEEDTLNAMATYSPLPLQNSTSITCGPFTVSTIESILQEMAAQGQSYFDASGDAGAYSPSDDGTDNYYPTESTWSTSAGGTDLTTNGAGGSWESEVAWNGSGGGPSPDGFAIPSYQQLSGVINSSNGGSTTLRNTPDVSIESNTDNYYCDEGVCGGGLGGTSFAGPTWAGFMALVNQQAAANGKSSAGFLNPTIYPLGLSSSYDTDFHDITSGNNNNGGGQSYNAVTGYDLITGWGSPNGQNMINALSGGGSTSCTPTPIVPYITVNGGSSWTEESSATVSSTSDTTVDLGPQPISGGSWAWTGPNGYTSTSRQINDIPLSTGSNVYTATYTNTNSCTSTQPFTITVTGSGYNVYGIYTNGTSFTSANSLDNDGYAYSSTELGTSLSWNGSTFTFGAANAEDAYSSTTISLPSGSYSKLNVLATAVNGAQGSQTFTVTYTNGTTTTITQSLSDWCSSSGFSGESIAKASTYRNDSNGTEQTIGCNLYGYTFAINSALTLESLTLPTNRDVVVLGVVPVASTSTTTEVNLSSSFNRIGIYTNGTTFSTSGGLDAAGSAYSETLLGSSLTWNSAPFAFGAANANDDISTAGQTITLPAGSYANLEILGTHVEGSNASESFKVNYTNGTSTTFTQGMSDWCSPQGYAGESTALATAYRNQASGTEQTITCNLYGYSFALNSALTVSSVVLPSDSNAEVLAITLFQ
jgi:subtilase family serine protease